MVWIFSLSKNMAKNISKNKSKNSTSKYGQKLLDHAKQSATDALITTSKTAIQNTTDATGDLIGNKTADTDYKCLMTKVSRISTQNNSETVANEHDKIYISKERYISPKERKKNICDLRFI